MEAVLVFSGFYESVHSQAVNDAEQQMFTDRDTGCTRNEGLEMALFDICNYHDVYSLYAKEYAVNFGEYFKIKLEFDKMRSPREYNFTTDRIFVNIPRDEAYRIRGLTDEKLLRETAREMFTSRDGFMSFYSPDIDRWGEVEDWDHNQLGCLLTAYANQEWVGMPGEDNGFDQWAEYELMSPDFENGQPENWISQCSPGVERLYKIHDYLEARSKR